MLRLAIWACTAGLLMACGAKDVSDDDSDGASGEGGTGAGGEQSRAGTAGSRAPDSPVCDDGDTRQCVGPGACQGGQVCSDGAWSSCDCGSAGHADMPQGGTGGLGSGGMGNHGGNGATGADGGTGGTNGGTNAGSGGDNGGGGEEGTPTEACDKASGRISIGVGTLISSGWTFKLSDGVNNSVTFVFDWLGDSATETGANVIEFSGEPTPAEWAVLIKDAINNTASDLEITATTTATAPVSGGAGGESGAGAGGQSGEASPPAPKTETVELRNKLAGARGNVTITETVGNPNFKVSGMSGGKAVICGSDASCSTDAECDADRSCSSAHVCD